MTADRYVAATRDRFSAPRRGSARWYRCRCGRWWGINKRTLCHCNAAPRSRPISASQQADSDRRQAAILDSLGHPEWASLVRGFVP